ncbi:MAG TPA: hypothetical protein VNI84_16740 [Pyrinomonadaceae bacterium]|nr:hypothetical protein [Pyrinomonadaceae bacterium]
MAQNKPQGAFESPSDSIEKFLSDFPAGIEKSAAQTSSEILLSSFGGNLSRAIAEIGAKNSVDLVIDRTANVTANTIIPPNIRVKWRNSGVFDVAGNATLIIGAMHPPGSQKIFAGSGNKVFAKGAVPYFNLAWWMGTDEKADATTALDNIVTSLANGFGGTAFIPTGTWRTNGGHNLPSHSIFQGLGRTAKLLLTANNSHILKIGGNLRDISVRDLVLDCENTKNSKCFLASGEYPNSTIGVEFTNTVFLYGDVGFDCLSMPPNPARYPGRTDGWELVNVTFNNCNWFGCERAFSCNTSNTAFSFNSPYIAVKANQTAIHCVLIGVLTIRNYLVVGAGKKDNATFIYTERAHGNFVIENGQDEGIQYFYRSSINSYLEVAIVLRDNLVQSIIQMNAPTTIYSKNNTYMANVFRNGAGVGAVVHSEGDFVTPRDVVSGNSVPNPSADALIAPGYFANKRNNAQTINTEREFNEDSLSPVLSWQTKKQTPPFPNQTRAVRRISSSNAGQVLLQLGTESESNFYGYSFYRDGENGNLVFEGNQTGYNNFEFKGDVIFSKSAQGIVLTAPNGKRFRLTVGIDGALKITAV